LNSSVNPLTTAAAEKIPRAALFAMSACCASSVANVYYAQPLLDALAAEFGITNAIAGSLISATQFGCAFALIFVVPLGDLISRKKLLCTELAMLVFALMVITVSTSPALLLIGMVMLGLLGTAVTQGMIAYAASLAAPAERGAIVGTVQSGVLVGVLGSRTVAGLVADVAGWRMVFALSGCVAAFMIVIVWRALPALKVAVQKLSYSQLLYTMFDLLKNERVLQIRGTLAFLVFASFGAFWSALVMPLRLEPYGLPHSQIGLFGLIGIAGALAASRAGRFTDKGQGQRITGLALLCMIVSWGFIAWLPRSLVALAVGIVLLDMGGQAVHVTNQSMVFKTRPELHSRLVGCYMLFYAAGLGMGAVAATSLHAYAGWSGVCWLGLGLGIMALLFWMITLRFMPISAHAK
jgi:predicted MFS family arabinose efflux permease